MDNLLSYLDRVGQISLDQLPLGEVDLAAFSQLVYVPLDEVVLPQEHITLEAAAQ
ncbi:MAG: hypothetical protein GX653_08495, partial [Clostridiales bacterium]|nr:hypothetical protein [Clostridiales bacterium]